jgi:hypothetical protein
MSRPAIKPWGFFSRLKETFEAFGWLITSVFGTGVMSTALALGNEFPVPWYQVLFLGVIVSSLIAIAFVQVAEYLRIHSIERAFRLKNVSAGSLGEDAESAGKFVVGLVGFLENRSVSPLFVKVERGSIALQGRTLDRMQLPANILEVQSGDVARLGFPSIGQLDIGQPITGHFAFGARFGRTKDNLSHFYYTEGDVLINVHRDGAQAMVQLQDSITESLYGKAPENW